MRRGGRMADGGPHARRVRQAQETLPEVMHGEMGRMDPRARPWGGARPQGVGCRRAVRRGIVLMTVLGPCRALEPPDPRAGAQVRADAALERPRASRSIRGPGRMPRPYHSATGHLIE